MIKASVTKRVSPGVVVTLINANAEIDRKLLKAKAKSYGIDPKYGRYLESLNKLALSLIEEVKNDFKKE